MEDATLELIGFDPLEYNDWGEWLPLIDITAPRNEITYSFITDFPAYGGLGTADADNFVIPPEDLRQGFRGALAHYESILDIEFVEVSDSIVEIDDLGIPRRGGLIRFGSYFNPLDPGFVTGTEPGLLEINSDVWVNLANGGPPFEAGGGSFPGVLFGLNRALGLEFATPPQGLAPHLPVETNTDQFSLMTDLPREDLVPPATLPLYDILSLIHI